MKLATRIFLLLTLTLLGVPGHTADKSDDNVSITLVADEGVMIRWRDTSIVIDSFGRSIHPDLLHGKPPFSRVQLIFVTHAHSDHFSPSITRDFLQKHPETTLATSPEILDIIRQGYSGLHRIENQLIALNSAQGKLTSLDFSGIKGNIIESKHAVSSLFPESVLGVIFHLGNKKILYLGESEMTAENWRNHNLKSHQLDIVILPFWIYKEVTTRKVLAQYIAPKKIVATMNLDQALTSRFASLVKQYPKVTFLEKMMQSIEVE